MFLKGERIQSQVQLQYIQIQTEEIYPQIFYKH